MIFSRIIISFLLLLSLVSFGLVISLNDKNGQSGRFVEALLAPAPDSEIENLSEILPSPIDEKKAQPRVRVFSSEEIKDGLVRRVMMIGRGETMASRLIMAGITRTEALRAMDAVRVYSNPAQIRTGQNITLLFEKTADGERFTGFELRTQGPRLVTVSRSHANTFRADVKEIAPERKRLALRGVVDDSLYESGLKAGVPATVLATLIKSYSYNVDFQRDVRKGDRFEVLFEQTVDENGRSQGDTTLIYAALDIGGKILPLYRVAMAGGNYEYFDAKGESIRKALLRTPLESAHVTSGFGMRRHPIMGYSRMHKGIDFAARTGTPIFAAGTGVIEEAGWKKGYGKYVRIRHNGKISTAYAHMSNFGRGISKGTRVTQGQVIGYVGSTGQSTGPHLHYEIMVNNEQVNPLKVAVNTATTLSGKPLVAFQDWRGKIHAQFENLIVMAEAGTRLTTLVQNNAQDKAK